MPGQPAVNFKPSSGSYKSNYNKHTQFYLIQKVKQFKHPRATSPLSQYPGSPGPYPRVLTPILRLSGPMFLASDISPLASNLWLLAPSFSPLGTDLNSLLDQ